jgi:hypothetical protein
VAGLLTVPQVVLETGGRHFRLGRETYAEQENKNSEDRRQNPEEESYAVAGLLTVPQVVLETGGRHFRLGRETYAEQEQILTASVKRKSF